MNTKRQDTILVVDDDPDVLKSLSILLENSGYAVINCNNAGDAFDMLQANNVDCLLTDIKMPETSGIDLLDRIRKTSLDIPIILMTAYADIDIMGEAIKKGVFDFIIKPSQPEQILHSVEKAVKYRRFIEIEKDYKHLLEEFSQEMETLISERTMNLMALTVADRVRNPATVIGFIAKKTADIKDIPKDVRDNLLSILNETDKLQHIVEDFQNLLKSRKSKFIYGDMNDIVESVLTAIDFENAAVSVRLSEKPLRINMEKTLLRVVVQHLVRNAVEAISGDGRISIETRQDEERVFFIISDTGPGIPSDIIDKIFTPFFSTKKQRFGMGLPLVKQIVSEHLGEIKVESQEGKGTTFIMSFPVRWKEK